MTPDDWKKLAMEYRASHCDIAGLVYWAKPAELERLIEKAFLAGAAAAAKLITRAPTPDIAVLKATEFKLTLDKLT